MTPYPSPNFGERRGGSLPCLIVLHYTAMETAQAALERLCDPVAEVSAHYLIDERGEVFSLVPEEHRAWHAGAGAWGPITDVNSYSIGIELSNYGAHPFPEPQMAALEDLLPQIMDRWAIRPEQVIGHSDMAPDRKFDPGRRFDWRRLAEEGLSVWPEHGEDADFHQSATTFGYAVKGREKAVLDAFRQRFRPYASGPLDASDRALMADLARRFPVDRSDIST
ncbi:N-acetylmuramoyl-L-alanine amidase [Actibacterium pelagium]|uniref:N-acetylmuramoyl-L-alanine amidase n=1 Tax=Actibacterium pelagium TaxID=2029103 RepID=A0A917AD23_9RHOB|nr:N-acetylmuramoyl-L-alanine amidase [Actibacterium pelagium]GGE44006.1 N-acetylmuramoyl-L-alanine amidase [Actibacterium pelagium]